MIQLTENEKNKIYRFNNDKEMVGAIKKVLLNSCLTAGIADNVQVLAASYLTIHFLEYGFKELSRMKPKESSLRYEENPAL